MDPSTRRLQPPKGGRHDAGCCDAGRSPHALVWLHPTCESLPDRPSCLVGVTAEKTIRYRADDGLAIPSA